jgi:hypothetical protein
VIHKGTQSKYATVASFRGPAYNASHFSFSADLERNMAVDKTDKVVQIKLPSGVTVWVMYYGGTVITWKNANG